MHIKKYRLYKSIFLEFYNKLPMFIFLILGSTVKLPLKGVSIQEAKRKKQEARNLKKNPIATSVAGPSNTPSSTVTLGMCLLASK